jgi:three-Cys-motif partner protein
MDDPQVFGGKWTLFKVDTVGKYLGAFSTAMKDLGFTRIYVDAFAGSGQFQFTTRRASPLFNEAEVVQAFPGSARRALEIKPPFDQLIFVERSRRNAKSLRSLQAAHPDRSVTVLQGEANKEVQALCRSVKWNITRGVIFLDPFGNSVEWSTVEALGKTHLDVWYLFPLAGVFRNAPLNWSKLSPDKRQTITNLLGTQEWETKFYEPPSARPRDLLSGLERPPSSNLARSFDVDGIEAFIGERLRTVFPLVLPPKRLLGPTRAPLYSLFFAMANPSPAAHRVGKAIAGHLLKGN